MFGGGISGRLFALVVCHYRFGGIQKMSLRAQRGNLVANACMPCIATGLPRRPSTFAHAPAVVGVVTNNSALRNCLVV